MKTKLLFFVVLNVLFISTSYAQNVNPELKPRPVDFEYLSAPDSLGIRHPLLMPVSKAKNQKAQVVEIKLPYPIIFLHGLNSNDLIWGDSTKSDLMGDFLLSKKLSFGGRFDFNLNEDGNNTKANKLFWPAPNADISQYSNQNSPPINGDFYFVNFDVGNDGSVYPGNSILDSKNVLSNQSAIAKQGAAIQRVVKQVLSLTGRDKVILMGHSMGGLAGREYIQNTEDWQDDNQHHIAKLVTTGTPHGGSNASTFGTFGYLFKGIDNQSEAVRDLRTSYKYAPYANGVFLKGGIESDYVMNDIQNLLLFQKNFYNVDVNCNNIIGENILGLNQKNLIQNLDFAYIMGNCTECVILQPSTFGDGIVTLGNANLGNFYNLPNPRNEFLYSANSTTEIHTDLPKQIYQNMQGLDEPNEYSLSYEIGFNKIYTGFITQQPANGYTNDYDDYKFIMPINGSFNISISNTFTDNLTFDILDSNKKIVYSNSVAPNSSNTFTPTLIAGNYYLEFSATPSSTSYLNPYTFKLVYSLSTPDIISDNSLKLYPNPTTSKVYFDNSKFNFEKVSIYNILGQEVSSSVFKTFSTNQEVDMDKLAKGDYILKMTNASETQSTKIIKN